MIKRICLVAIAFALSYLAATMLMIHGLRTDDRDFWIIVGSSGLGTLSAYLAVTIGGGKKKSG